MKNAAVAKVFENVADLLEIKEENPFKIRAYRRAARAIESLPVELAQLIKEGKLREVPGIGEAISKKIETLLTTGSFDLYDRLRAEFPEGVITLMNVPGIGPKTAMRLVKELGISDVEELEKVIIDGEVAGLFRLGDKTSGNILRHLQAMRRKDQRVPLGHALPTVEEIIVALNGVPGVYALAPVGSLRRFKETIGDIDIMGTAENPTKVLQGFVQLPQVDEVLAQGATKASVILANGLQVDLRMVEQDSFGSLLQYFTGSKEHNIALRERGVRQGLKLSEYGITNLKTGEMEKFATEGAYYEKLGLEFIPPELRERRGEIELAERKALPELVELSEIKGDLHVHTDWSDGHNSIEEMVLGAKARGYEYLAIADHSSGRGIARGLNEERLRNQIAEIRRINQNLSGIQLLASIEVDIRADGTLDFPDSLLAELDIVVAGVHSAMGQDKGRMTKRVIKALENPLVHILAHPTCRLLGERESVDMDMEEIFRAAACTNTALEINAMPERLDLKDIHVFRAKELGGRVIINTDAHSVEQLGFMRFGLGVARRGWCQKRHILNTMSLAELRPFLHRANK